MKTHIFDTTPCTLGEGPLWHPKRQQLFWFDILNKMLLTKTDAGVQTWHFPDYVSAAGWIDEDRLLIASSKSLFTLNLTTEAQTPLAELESDNPITRSNDGRADPWGGFWIGTMGINAEFEAGAIYRYYKGEIRQCLPKITIANALCFSPNRDYVYFADTPKQIIWKQKLRMEDGWPDSHYPREVFVDLTQQNLNPDGAVVDSEGYLWNAQWGASAVRRYSPTGTLDREIFYPVDQVTCPAFGGVDCKRLFMTSAGLDKESDIDGQTYYTDTDISGQQEHQIFV